MTNDLENITKATHSTGFLLDELREVHKSDNAIISDVAYDLIAQAADVHKRLKRLLQAVQTQAEQG